MRVAVFAIACACGGSPKPAPAPAPPLPVENVGEEPVDPSVTADRVCSRILQLQAAHCQKLAEVDAGASCRSDYVELAKDSAGRLFGACIVKLDTCSDVVACLGAVSASPDLRACDDHSDDKMGMAVGVPRGEYMALTARHSTRFSQIHSTQKQPIEMCGVATQNEWLATLACDDGSQPILTRGDAERTRTGDMGPGGRCGSIIDLYRVQCPEARYDIYLDGYICPRTQ